MNVLSFSLTHMCMHTHTSSIMSDGLQHNVTCFEFAVFMMGSHWSAYWLPI